MGLGSWSLATLSTIYQLYCGGQLHWWRKPVNPKKTTDLPQVNANQVFELTTLVVMGIDYIGKCKSNYRTITTK